MSQAYDVSDNAIGSTINSQTSDDSPLAVEPTIIRAKSGERLWLVENTIECITLCKSQLTVSLNVQWLIERMNPRDLHSA
jgi:hypothetical protein